MSDQIQRETRLPASIEEAWAALTDPSWLELWLADEVELELRPGGDARFRLGSVLREGWVEEVLAPGAEDGARLVFWWAGEDQLASRVELTLTAEEDGCRLRVIEARPLEVLDVIGMPLPGAGGGSGGPVLIAA